MRAGAAGGSGGRNFSLLVAFAAAAAGASAQEPFVKVGPETVYDAGIRCAGPIFRGGRLRPRRAPGLRARQYAGVELRPGWQAGRTHGVDGAAGRLVQRAGRAAVLRPGDRGHHVCASSSRRREWRRAARHLRAGRRPGHRRQRRLDAETGARHANRLRRRQCAIRGHADHARTQWSPGGHRSQRDPRCVRRRHQRRAQGQAAVPAAERRQRELHLFAVPAARDRRRPIEVRDARATDQRQHDDGWHRSGSRDRCSPTSTATAIPT